MSSPLDKLEPRLVWKHFDAIRQIPRPSKHEERIAEHVVGWGRSRGLVTERDGVGNVLVKVPATPGHEKAPVIVLQGHLDMVPEKNSDVAFDFEKDAIQVRVVGDYVYATGTTLGSDNGIGVATAMAVAEDPKAVHGPLELLFTIDEETGLTGAMQLDPKLLTGRTMINLDTEEDAALYIGCAGGADTHADVHGDPRGRPAADPARAHLGAGLARRPLGRRHPREPRQRPQVPACARWPRSGRAGSSSESCRSRAGASTTRSRARPTRSCGSPPRARARCRRPWATARASCGRSSARSTPASGLECVALEDRPDNRKVFIRFDNDRVVDALLACPHGVLAMSRAVPGLVETSNNLAVVTTEGNAVKVVTSSRSSVMPSLKATTEQVGAAFRLGGAAVEHLDGYPGWKPNPNSPVLNCALKVFERDFGKKPAVKAIHAGLECGLIGEKYPGMDMVSMGPQIESPHSPDERVQISTVDKFYRLLTATLKELA